MKTDRPQMFRFRRKPANALQESPNQKHQSSFQAIQKTKTLVFANKICEVNIYPSPLKKSIEESLAYSIQLTPITSTQKKKVQNQKMMQVRKHLYGSPQIIEQRVETGNDQSLLLDFKQILDQENKHKMPVTPNTNCSYSSAEAQNQEQQSKQSQNICSHFHMMMLIEYKLNFFHLNKNTIKVQYVPFKQESNEKRDYPALVERMRIVFYRQPLLLFDFIYSTLQKWSKYTLKMFLLSNSIKFTTEEIKSFISLIDQMSSTLNMHQIGQTLFLTSEEQQQMVINSQKTKMTDLLSPQQNSFLKLYLAMIQENTTDTLSQFLPYIEQFFRKVI